MPKRKNIADNPAVKAWGSLVGPLGNTPGAPFGMTPTAPVLSEMLLVDEISGEIDQEDEKNEFRR